MNMWVIHPGEPSCAQTLSACKCADGHFLFFYSFLKQYENMKPELRRKYNERIMKYHE